MPATFAPKSARVGQLAFGKNGKTFDPDTP